MHGAVVENLEGRGQPGGALHGMIITEDDTPTTLPGNASLICKPQPLGIWTLLVLGWTGSPQKDMFKSQHPLHTRELRVPGGTSLCGFLKSP